MSYEGPYLTFSIESQSKVKISTFLMRVGETGVEIILGDGPTRGIRELYC